MATPSYNGRVDPHLDLAKELLEDAKLLLMQARHRSAVSRAYYAAYHACIALSQCFGLRPRGYLGRGDRRADRWEHGIITTVVASDPRVSQVITTSAARQMRWQYVQRIRGDYRADHAVSSLAAHTSVSLAEQIVDRVERHLHA